MLILPANVGSNKPLAGEHTYDTDYDFPFDYDKAWFGWVTHNGKLDSLTPIFSHELVEACTDPEGDGIQVNPRNDSNWNEIGDVCCSTARLNGVLVQSYWSDRDKACIIPTGLVNGLVAGTAALVQGRFGERGNFELAVSLQAGGLAHYWRDNDDPFLHWLGPDPFGGSVGQVDLSMIQSNFGNPGNLELVARTGNQLIFFWRDSGPAYLWSGPFIVIADGLPVTGVSSNPALIQGRFGNRGNFELAVPLETGGLAHFWRDNDDPRLPWHGPYPFGGAAGLIDAVTMIESNFDSPGNLEVVARIGSQLVFFWRDSGPNYLWRGPSALISDGLTVTGVSGNPALIQSRFGNRGNFELVVPLAAGGLAHFWRDNDDPQLPWHGPYPFGRAAGVVDAVAMIESNFGNPGNLEVVARVGNQLVFFWRDSGPGFIWSGPTPITSGS
jgi:hypothetical protein